MACFHISFNVRSVSLNQSQPSIREKIWNLVREKTAFPVRERGKKPASKPSPYTASSAGSTYNPYAARAQEPAANDGGFDAPAPSTFDAEPGYYAGGARPIVPATTRGGAYQPQPFYTPAGPVIQLA